MTIGTLGLIGLSLLILLILVVASIKGKELIEDEEEDEPEQDPEIEVLREIELSGSMSHEEAQLIAETTGYEVTGKNEQGMYVLKLRDTL